MTVTSQFKKNKKYMKLKDKIRIGFEKVFLQTIILWVL